MKKKMMGLAAAAVLSAMLLPVYGSETCPPETESGWVMQADIISPVLTKDAAEVFENAIAGYTGMGLKPAALLATQTADDVNYLYLCTGQMIVPNAQPGWYLVTTRKDAEDRTRISHVEELDVTDLKTSDQAEEAAMPDGWTCASPSNAITLPEKAWFAFEHADKDTDVTLSPLALLATQTESAEAGAASGADSAAEAGTEAGETDLVFCLGTAAKDSDSGFYAVTMQVDPEGNATLAEVRRLDLAAYLDGRSAPPAKPVI